MPAPESEKLTATRVLSHLGVMAAIAVIMGVIVAGLAIPFAGMAGIGARNVAQSMDNLPEELEARPLAQKTTIVDSKGDTIATLYDENRVNVSLDQISRPMLEAIVAIEDYRFYQHGALDLKGTLRALVTNQAANGVVQGGSSITQQMVKLTLINQAETDEERIAATDDTYSRKLRELRYAIAIEEKYSKDWILERYLNIAYFGDGVHGIQAAARHYFDRNAKKLNVRQAALLAGLVKNPTGYDPTNSPDRARDRRNVVLDRMAQLNVIPREKADKLKGKNLGLKVVPTPNGCVNSRAPFFCDYVLSYLMADKALGKTAEERKRLLFSGGLTVKTTVDVRYQDAADEGVQNHVRAEDRAIGAMAMVEPGTGHVKAIAQSRPMGRRKNIGQTYLNYVVNQKYGDSNGFQPGSTFKAFVLAAAINQGIPLNKTFNAAQTMQFPERDFKVCDDQPYQSTNTWKVGNSTSSGTFDLYKGTQLSVNTFFAQLERETGLCEPYELAQAMGIELDNPAGEMVPSFTLGVADVSPLEMAGAYATFAARGKYCETRPVTAIEDMGGNTLKKYPNNCRQVLPGAVADAVNDVLKGVTAPGGFAGRIAPPVPSAGKTGTTQEGKAVWFVGYTPQVAGAAMIAGADRVGRPIRLAGQTIGGRYISTASGSGFAGPIWGDTMRVVSQWLEARSFTRPPAVEIAGVLTQVPSTTGMSVDSARKVLSDAGFEPQVASAVNSNVTKGNVAYTSPSGGSSFASGDTVTIYPSTGYVPPPPKKKDPPKKKKPGKNRGRG
ncbi:transglycosylase domain-containing protein [Nocardioides sp.]|uniref:transglycosylase domain-containing protein n=1 Tax=Nocardioides sp. TaxID=35761 RepID=UPI0027327FA7|nr:transglycosylase domain-containing protein [Nocardioides sp.]MDP3889877.1 transglycosylase domain-containing protein [Nocardioides sp.]